MRYQLEWLASLAVAILIGGLGAACGGKGSSTPTSPILPTAPAPSTNTITSCSVVAKPGSYSMTADPQGPGANPCVAITSPDVTLDCGGHLLPSVTLSGVQNVTLTRCSIGGTVEHPIPTGPLLIVQASSGVTITNSSLDDVSVTGSDHVTFDNDHVINQNPNSPGALNIATSSFITVSNSTIDHFQAYGVLLGTSHDNSVTGNTIDGTMPGSAGKTARDDAIVLDTEQNDLIANNTMINLPDAGVEGVNSVVGAIIDGNTMQGVGFAGVGSYYETSWHKNTIRNNRVSGSRWFLDFEYQCDCGNVNTHLLADIGFADNLIQNNVARVSGSGGLSVNVGFVQPIPLPVVVTNNTITGNDFGGTAVKITPSSGFINGGGNVCAPSASFVCGG